MEMWYPLANIFENNISSKFALSILIIALAFGAVDAKTAAICTQGCDYLSISAGLDAAKPGDTLEVHSGIYHENINITKPLRLKGLDKGQSKPIIDAGGKGNAITLSTDGIILDGFNVTNSLGSWLEIRAGIKVTSNNNTITNNLVFNNENGIIISGSSNNTIKANKAINNKYGIKVESASKNDIVANNLSDNNYGLVMVSSVKNKIEGNNVSNNDLGMKINASSNNSFNDNKMIGNIYNFEASGNNNISTNNLVDGKPIYYLLGVSGRIFDSSSSAGTVYCIDCNNVTIKGLTLNNNSNGIYLFNTTNSIIENNNLSYNRNGIYIVNSNRTTIVGNNVSHNIDGIVLISSKYNGIGRNIALDNDDAGLLVIRSNYNNITYNEVVKNDKGFFILKSGFNRVGINNLSENLIAIYFKSAWLNDILNNGIFDNSNGILLESSPENNITKNRIFNNVKGLLYDPLDSNALKDNLMLNNEMDREEIVTKSTAQPPGSGPSISIDVYSNPKGAAILKDGEYTGITPGKVYFTEPGNYTLELSMKGYKDKDLHVVIPLKTKEIRAGLERETNQ
jgi:parallel beta-helix repeat protein